MSIESQILEGKSPKQIGISEHTYHLYVQLLKNRGVLSEEAELIPPSTIEMVKSVAKAGVQAVKSGFKRVSEEEADRRLGICEGCDQFNQEARRCRACGCWVDFKTQLEAWHCPIGKW